MKKILSLAGVVLFLLVLTQIMSCKKETKQPEVIASFSISVDSLNFLVVTFTNQSQNYSALLWNFGDGSATSSEENPVHTFPGVGDYNVTLTATSENGDLTDTYTKSVSISDPNAELTKLVGEGNDGKVWKLLRDVSTGRYPLLVFPYNPDDPNTPTTLWWGMGLANDELANRPCMLNDEWTFFRDGSFTYDAHGDYWAEGGVFTPDNICASTADPMTGVNGEDLSAWGNGTHTFELVTGTDPMLKAIGNGAFVGFIKAATDYEVMNLDPMVQDEVDYHLVKLSDADNGTDTLIVQCNYYFAQGDATPGGSWRFTLVHYDNPADEPPIPTNNPSPNFSYTLDGSTVTFTNTSQFCDSYSWDFGDGGTSTESDPVHSYAADGIYTVTLTGTNANGTATTSQDIWVSTVVLTEAMLQGAPWRVQVGDKTVFVGDGLGHSNWWACPKAFLDGSTIGNDDWSCMPDDEFTFGADGTLTYDGKGSVRNDGYLAEGQGCVDEASITGNGVAFTSGTNSYTFTPATGDTRPIIDLTNGPDRAAFIGFYKGYYGGENSAAPGADQPLPNGGMTTNRYEVMGYINDGTKEYLFVSVDITPDHSGTSAWSVILER